MDYDYETNKKKSFKNIIPKSGSYDFKNAQPLANINGTIRLKETHIYHNSNMNSNQNYKINTNKSTKNLTPMLSNSKKVLTKLPEKKIDLNSSLFDKIFPKYKRSLVGIPLLCLAYFATIYFIAAYGAISVLSVYQLINGDLTNMYPLFLLVIGYIAITVMSLLLIIAIYKEMLNFVACWIIVISVFILPEIGLNILLANNSLNWFNTSMGFYTLVILIVRVCCDLPCIFFILVYHINVTKKNVYLKNLMMPLKDRIVNGDVLKIYNSIKIDNFDANAPSQIYHSMPAHLNESITSGTNLNTSQSQNQKTSTVVTFSDKKLNEFNYRPNTYFYRFSPLKTYSIQLKPTRHTVDFDHDTSTTTNDLNALHLVWNKSNRNRNQMTNFDYLRKMHQSNGNHNQEFESNQIFQIPIHADTADNICTNNCNKSARRALTASESFNSTSSNNNNKSLGLTNHQIYLPPSPYENNYIKIAKSFQI